MKKYFYGLVIFLFIGITMQSCKDDQNAPSFENQTTQQEANTASWNHVQQQLNALDMSYGLTKNIRRAPSVPGNLAQVSDYTNWDFTNMGFSWGAAKADAEGACTGIGAGVLLGGALGSAIPAIGNAVGAAAGGIIGGLAVGPIFSAAYKEENGTQALIHPYNPFIYIPQGNRFADAGNAPIGSEIGELHNCLLIEMLQDANFMALTSLEDMFDYICAANITSLSDYFSSSQITEVQSFLTGIRADVLDTADWGTRMIAQGYGEELNIIKHYAYAVSQTTTPFDMEQYTSDFMQLVDDAYTNNQISETSALIINGTISTMYCSKTAWNYIQPDPYQTTRYILHGDNTWYIADGQEDAEAIMADDTTIDFVGYPYIENGEVKRIYVYTELPYNINLHNYDLVLQELNGGDYTNTIDVVTDGTDHYSIALGSHHVLPAIEYANYVYIDFEQ